MLLSVEISLYPLHSDYIPLIDHFLETLNAHAATHVEIRTNNMSTRIFGPYDDVMQLLTLSMKTAMHTSDKLVFITKFINTDTRELQDYD